ncbi:MAG: hypothetical protein Ct9H90mP1_0940 [Methanobacteriota archaeon]|nr:MAG: hypothetical protein Ct9H90mP1_0940 [Euryarchaeota archaeon]
MNPSVPTSHSTLGGKDGTRWMIWWINFPTSSKKIRPCCSRRWQPLHVGHEWLIQQELDLGKKVVVGIRDTPVSEKDPYSPSFASE